MQIFVLALALLVSACASGGVQSAISMTAPRDVPWEHPTIWAEGVDGVLQGLGGDACSLLDTEVSDDRLVVAMIPRRAVPPASQRDQDDRPPRILTRNFRAVLDLPATANAPADRVAIIVPRHFSSDFYSVPRKGPLGINLRAFVTDLQFAPEPSVLHDWLYAVGVDGDERDRAFADRVFLAAMERELVDKDARGRAHKAVADHGEAGHGHAAELRFFDPASNERVRVLQLNLEQREQLRRLTVCRSSER